MRLGYMNAGHSSGNSVKVSPPATSVLDRGNRIRMIRRTSVIKVIHTQRADSCSNNPARHTGFWGRQWLPHNPDVGKPEHFEMEGILWLVRQPAETMAQHLFSLKNRGIFNPWVIWKWVRKIVCVLVSGSRGAGHAVYWQAKAIQKLLHLNWNFLHLLDLLSNTADLMWTPSCFCGLLENINFFIYR